MTIESVETSAPKEEARGRSTIEFPYLDLENSLEVAESVRQVGGTGCEWKQLAVKMGMTPDGGGFRMRLMTAKTFGLLTYDRGNINLTDLGIEAIDPLYAKRAKADAFLKVPLFRQLFDKLNGVPLPPPAAVERMAEQLGVAPKQKDKARQVFMRSAKQAGMFDLSPDRLSVPPTGNGQNRDAPADVPPPKNGGGGGGDGGGNGSEGYDPFIVGLLRKLPPTDSVWTVKDRIKWLQTAAKAFDLIYSTGEDDQREIVISAEKEDL